VYVFVLSLSVHTPALNPRVDSFNGCASRRALFLWRIVFEGSCDLRQIHCLLLFCCGKTLRYEMWHEAVAVKFGTE
jgi:hypothetical protein